MDFDCCALTLNLRATNLTVIELDGISLWNFRSNSKSDQPTLDKRKAPISCHFQQKTMWDTNDTFQMRLSSAEFLAKELKPTFIYVFKVNDKLEFSDAFLIHIFGSPLEVILKRLRAEEAKGKRSRINTKKLSMSTATLGQRIEPTGDALRGALEKLCGDDPHRYVEAKEAQLKELDFKLRPYRTAMTLHVDDSNELVDVFLGLKKNIPVSGVRTLETRFGIDLPAGPNFDAGGTLTLNPDATDQCIVTYRRQRLTSPAVFDADVVFAPRIVTGPDQVEALIRSEFFNIRYSKSNSSLAVSSSIDESRRAPLRKWRNFFELSLELAKGEGELLITPKRLPATITIPIQNPTIEGFDLKLLTLLIEVCDSLARIFDAAGLNQDFHLTLKEIRRKATEIREVDAILNEPQRAGSIKFSTPAAKTAAENLKNLSAIRIAYVNFLTIAEATIGYAVKAEMTARPVDEVIEWASTSLAPFDVCLLDDSLERFQRYVEQMHTSTGADGVMSPESATGPGVVEHEGIAVEPAGDVSSGSS